MCDILQSQQVGNHTSVNLRQLTECVLRSTAAASSTEPVPPECCPQPQHDHRQKTLTTTEFMFKKLFTYPGPTCGYTVTTPNTGVCGHGGGAATQFRRYAPQPKIEYICQTNQRPVASTRIAQIREAAASTSIYQAHERAPARLPCPPPPQAPQPGVPRARCVRSRF